ncbi:MAG: hypothetical protein FWD23_07290 [Oscillospiraceae bacterium]|nr:hypothetical protein [Oscillospiraceae bacterium]
MARKNIEAGDGGLTTRAKLNDNFIELYDQMGNRVVIEVGNANKIIFADGQTFQQKYNSGELKGPQGSQGNSIKGDSGVPAYVHVRWGTSLTPETLLMTPDEYIGIVSTSNPIAPTTYAGYYWYKYKGDKGDTGEKGDTGDKGEKGEAGSDAEIEAATQTEVNEGTITNKFVNPSHKASQTNRGLIRIATQSEAITGTSGELAMPPVFNGAIKLPDNAFDGLTAPTSYPRGETVFFSNNPANRFNNLSYCTVVTYRGYNINASTAGVMQFIYPYNVDGPVYYRTATTASWNAWRTIINAEDAQTISGAKTFSAAMTVNNTITTNNTITGTRLISNVATGTAPLTVTSTTAVANLNADMADGLHVNTTGVNNVANQIARTNSNGYLMAGYINTNVAIETPAIGSVFVQNTAADGYLRKVSLASLSAAMGTSGNMGRMVSGSYTGDGGTSRTISGLPFQPKLAIILSRTLGDFQGIGLFSSTRGSVTSPQDSNQSRTVTSVTATSITITNISTPNPFYAMNRDTYIYDYFIFG